MSLTFDLAFEPRYGEAVPVADGVLRITAANANAMTFRGTNTYLIGRERLLVVDPGPRDDAHLSAVLAAIADRKVAAILMTHGHSDHSDLAPALRDTLDVPIFASPLYAGAKDAALGDGQIVELGDEPVEVVATPGHSRDHLCFALPSASLLFSGDHVMAWSTTVVAAPDGRMADYMQSLERLISRPETTYLPGHGGPVERVQTLLRGLRTHRRMREAAILARLESRAADVASLVADLYRDLDPALRPAARLSVRAHLEDLIERGRVRSVDATGAEGPFETVPTGVTPRA